MREIFCKGKYKYKHDSQSLQNKSFWLSCNTIVHVYHSLFPNRSMLKASTVYRFNETGTSLIQPYVRININ